VKNEDSSNSVKVFYLKELIIFLIFGF